MEWWHNDIMVPPNDQLQLTGSVEGMMEGSCDGMMKSSDDGMME